MITWPIAGEDPGFPGQGHQTSGIGGGGGGANLLFCKMFAGNCIKLKKSWRPLGSAIGHSLILITARNEVAKVMFLHVSVILSMDGQVCSRGACSKGGVETPQQTATAADGTHPTGMHSCLFCLHDTQCRVMDVYGLDLDHSAQ